MVYMEAYDKLLESWLTLVQDDKHFHKGFFTQHAVQVFNSYIQCHLAAPDGTRNLVSFWPDYKSVCRIPGSVLSVLHGCMFCKLSQRTHRSWDVAGSHVLSLRFLVSHLGLPGCQVA